MAPAVISATKGNSFPVIMGPLKGIRLPKEVAIQNLGMLVGRYEPHVVRKIRSMAGSIRVAYDIGSHVGYMALVLCRCGAGRIYAFEPVSSNAFLIEDVVADNGLASKVVVIPKAVAHADGRERIHTWQNSSMFFIGSAHDGQPLNPDDSFTVQSCTLDSFVFEDVEDPPDFIKLDVEGAEELVIQGALRTLGTYNPRMLIEMHGPRNALGCWSRLAPFQYEWTHIAGNGKETLISTAEGLTGIFSSSSWTAHFFLSRKK